MASSPTTQADQDMPWEPNLHLGETDDDALGGLLTLKRLAEREKKKGSV